MSDGPDWDNAHRLMEETERWPPPAGPTDSRSSAERFVWDEGLNLQVMSEGVVVLVRRIVEAFTPHG